MNWSPKIIKYQFIHRLPKVKPHEHTAWLIDIPQPFGLHLVVSAFSGEIQYSVICTGGHEADVLVVDHKVDCTIRTTHYIDLEEAIKYWLSLMPLGLKQATRKIITSMRRG